MGNFIDTDLPILTYLNLDPCILPSELLTFPMTHFLLKYRISSNLSLKQAYYHDYQQNPGQKMLTTYLNFVNLSIQYYQLIIELVNLLLHFFHVTYKNKNISH